jgi:hypothetical protein
MRCRNRTRCRRPRAAQLCRAFSRCTEKAISAGADTTQPCTCAHTTEQIADHRRADHHLVRELIECGLLYQGTRSRDRSRLADFPSRRRRSRRSPAQALRAATPSAVCHLRRIDDRTPGTIEWRQTPPERRLPVAGEWPPAVAEKCRRAKTIDASGFDNADSVGPGSHSSILEPWDVLGQDGPVAV